MVKNGGFGIIDGKNVMRFKYEVLKLLDQRKNLNFIIISIIVWGFKLKKNIPNNLNSNKSLSSNNLKLFEVGA